MSDRKINVKCKFINLCPLKAREISSAPKRLNLSLFNLLHEKFILFKRFFFILAMGLLIHTVYPSIYSYGVCGRTKDKHMPLSSMDVVKGD
jgi:hypothetical protein